jgi:hypothetical protein
LQYIGASKAQQFRSGFHSEYGGIGQKVPVEKVPVEGYSWKASLIRLRAVSAKGVAAPFEMTA